jgi:ATP-dependent DNA helicase DinG
MTITVEEVFAACDLSKPTDIQIDYANHVLSSLKCSTANSGGDVMIEAETGVGKTLGYLIPAAIKAVENDGRVIVSTYTKSLQRQVMEDAARMLVGIQRVTGRALRVARLVGKSNFFDIARVRRIKQIAESDNAPESVIDAWDDLIEWIESEGSTGEIQDYIDEFGGLPGDISPTMVCLDSTSPAEAKVKYTQHVLEAAGADILVTNHALLCIASMRNVNLLHNDADRRPLVAVIVDEADRLPDAARSLVADQAPLVQILRVAEKLSEKKVLSEHNARAIHKAAEEMLAAAVGMETHYSRHEAILIDDLLSHDRKALEDAARNFAGAIEQCNGELKKAQDNPDTHDLVSDLLRYRNTLKAALLDEHATSATGVLQYSPSRRYPSVALARLYPARVVGWMLDYMRNGGVGDEQDAREPFGTALVLTSATLSGPSTGSGDRFWEMKIQFGIFDRENKCGHLHAAFSPDEFGEIKRIVLPDPSVPKPFKGVSDEDTVEISEEWIDYTAKMLAEAQKEGGYVLGLTGSYLVASRLKMKLDAMGVRVVQKFRSEHIDSAIKRLLGEEAGVFITPGGWEGLNARGYGFSWQSVVICQIPLSRTDSAYKAALVDYLTRKGKSRMEAESIVYGETMSAAFRKMKQGIGRGIRSSTDSFTLWIADPRMPMFGSVTHSNEPVPRAVNRQFPQFVRCIPARFMETPTEVFLKDGTTVR